MLSPGFKEAGPYQTRSNPSGIELVTKNFLPVTVATLLRDSYDFETTTQLRNKPYSKICSNK